MRTLHQCPPSPNHGPCPGHSSQWTFQHFLEGTAYHLQTSLAAFSVTLDQMYFQNFQYQECEPLHSEDEEEAQVRCGKTLSTKLKPPGERKRVSALVFSRPHQNSGEHRPSMDLNLQCLFKLHKGCVFSAMLWASPQESKAIQTPSMNSQVRLAKLCFPSPSQPPVKRNQGYNDEN